MKYKIIILIAIFAAAGWLISKTSAQHSNHETEASSHSDHDHEEHSDNTIENEEHEEHDGHDEHAGHEHEEHSEFIELTSQEKSNIGIRTAIAAPGMIDQTITASGQITLNTDTMSYITPVISGIVKDVYVKLGDSVSKDQTVALIISRELAECRTAYIAAFESHNLIQVTLDREESLFKEKLASQADLIEARQAAVEAKITMELAAQNLISMGISSQELTSLQEGKVKNLAEYLLKSPSAGQIIEKDINIGQALDDSEPVITIADLSTVWLDININAADAHKLELSQPVVATNRSVDQAIHAKLDYISPVINDQLRTVMTRSIISNSDNNLLPGSYVSALISVARRQAPVVIEQNAIQVIGDKKCVFIVVDHGYEAVFIKYKPTVNGTAEVLSGLVAGTEYVTEGAFALKSKIVTANLGSHAGHGH